MTKLMADTSITKVSVAHSPRGHAGQKYLASGIHVSMRLWEREEPSVAKPKTSRGSKPKTSRGYETVGFVIEGKAELHIEDQLVLLEKGDSWVVPKGASHTYKVLETFTAVEATSPPAEVHGRDE
jgi:mannose-6-phosphate isomerase-like protein (cupin superfamily)